MITKSSYDFLWEIKEEIKSDLKYPLVGSATYVDINEEFEPDDIQYTYCSFAEEHFSITRPVMCPSNKLPIPWLYFENGRTYVLTRLIVPEGVSTIFSSITDRSRICHLREVVLPESVKIIDERTFRNCYRLCNINLENVKYIGKSAFQHTPLSKADLSSCICIDEDAFCFDRYLELIRFSKDLSFIGANAFIHSGLCMNGRRVSSVYCTEMWKATNSAMRCRGFQYEIGKWYMERNISMCQKGFHFCENLFNIFGFYNGDLRDVRIFKITAAENIYDELYPSLKSVCSNIRFDKEINFVDTVNLHFKEEWEREDRKNV